MIVSAGNFRTFLASAAADSVGVTLPQPGVGFRYVIRDYWGDHTGGAGNAGVLSIFNVQSGVVMRNKGLYSVSLTAASASGNVIGSALKADENNSVTLQSTRTGATSSLVGCCVTIEPVRV